MIIYVEEWIELSFISFYPPLTYAIHYKPNESPNDLKCLD